MNLLTTKFDLAWATRQWRSCHTTCQRNHIRLQLTETMAMWHLDQYIWQLLTLKLHILNPLVYIIADMTHTLKQHQHWQTIGS